MSNNKDKITTIIKALLAKAAGTDNEHEAAIFAAKAQELMEKHQVSVTDVLQDDPIGGDILHKGRGDGPARYTARLACSVARYYGAKVVMRSLPKGKIEIHMVGRESSRITAELMLPFIKKQLSTRAKALALETGHNEAALLRDITNALILRIDKLIRESEARQPEPAHAKNALTVVNEIQRQYEIMFPNVVMGRRSSVSTSKRAREEAEKVSLARQTTGEKRGLLR